MLESTCYSLTLEEKMQGKQSILYLDDEAVCLTVFAEMFRDSYDVRTATNLSDARRMLMEQPADIVISDQRMPDIDGTEFLREISELYPTSFRVLLTGSVTVGGMLSEIGAGIVNLFIAKPWTKDDIGQMLERAAASLRSPDTSSA